MNTIFRTKLVIGLFIILLTSSCADSRIRSSELPVQAFSKDHMTQIYDQRTWVPDEKINYDLLGFGKKASITPKHARTKIVGPSYTDALESLAAKIWMIENAQYSVDLVYYIFKRDPVGYAILGALCNAVQRGVDIRIMVDSAGSFHPHHDELRALETCAENAGFIKDKSGQATTKKARVQTVIINAISKVLVRMNRRAHDKLIVVDGHIPKRAIIMTGGRNISVSYYGINKDGSPDPSAYQDLELILRPNKNNAESEDSIGAVTTYYYTILFLHAGNKRLYPIPDDENSEHEEATTYSEIYKKEREKAQKNLNFIKNIPGIKSSLSKMPSYLTTNYHDSWVRLAHELGNLTNEKAVSGVVDNLRLNPNSIQTLLYSAKLADRKEPIKKLTVVSPYFFVAKYYDDNDEVIYDGVKELYDILDKRPETTVELITNSVLTSDNFFAQAVIDMDTAARLLLSESPEILKQWLSDMEDGEFNPKLVESKEWKRLINNPRIKIYQTGKLDSALLGGNKHYGKLHAKGIFADGGGFIGTSNFDYRSRLLNNELGFYFKSDGLYGDATKIINDLKSKSYLWGTPEWLQMRKKLMKQDGTKASTTRKQRGLFKTLNATGTTWLF